MSPDRVVERHDSQAGVAMGFRDIPMIDIDWPRWDGYDDFERGARVSCPGGSPVSGTTSYSGVTSECATRLAHGPADRLRCMPPLTIPPIRDVRLLN
jgi:hypothetical protein